MKTISFKQKGAALILFALVVVLMATTFLVSQLDVYNIDAEREKKTAAALAEAKSALVGSVTGAANVATPNFLPNPDLKLSGAIPEGSQAGLAGGVDISLIGKFPWHSLGVSPLKDGWNECLWYVVSGRFKNSPSTDIFNWDTQGQINVVDNNANVLKSNLAAIIVSPSQPLQGQNRQLTGADTPQCGGNYDAKNYLDTFDASNALAGLVNYFAGSTNNRQAPNTNDKVFVQSKNDFYNDQIMYVTTDEIFRPIIQRSDFALQVSALLNDIDFMAIMSEITITSALTLPSSPKGTGNLGIECECSPPSCATNKSIANINNRTFCKNWKEMLLLTELSPPMPINIDGTATASNCGRLVIFGGQKIGVQVRATVADKNAVENYLEGVNLTEFNTPIAIGGNFTGVSTFNSSSSSDDILKCL